MSYVGRLEWTSNAPRPYRWKACTTAKFSVAADEGRVLVSHDQNTMEGHLREFIRTRNSPGLILIPQRRVSIGQAIESLELIWDVLDAADLENRVCLFPSLVIY